MIPVLRMTLLEAARKRLLWVLAALTIASVALTGWGLGQLVGIARGNGSDQVQLAIGVSQILILVAFMFSFILAMTAAFLGAPAIATEIDTGVTQAMLARPLRRSELVIGKWLGLLLVVGVYAMASGLLEIGVVALLTGYTPPDPLGAVLYLAAQAGVLLTIALALSTRLPSIAAGVISVVVFGLAWMMGVLGGIGAFFRVDVLERAAQVTRVVLPTDLLWRGVVYSLEPPIIVIGAGARVGPAAQANPFYASAAPPLIAIVWVVVWIAAVLGIAVWLMRRREI